MGANILKFLVILFFAGAIIFVGASDIAKKYRVPGSNTAQAAKDYIQSLQGDIAISRALSQEKKNWDNPFNDDSNQDAKAQPGFFKALGSFFNSDDSISSASPSAKPKVKIPALKDEPTFKDGGSNHSLESHDKDQLKNLLDNLD